MILQSAKEEQDFQPKNMDIMKLEGKKPFLNQSALCGHKKVVVFPLAEKIRQGQQTVYDIH